MNNSRRVWIDSKDCGLVIVEAERQRAEELERKRKEAARRKLLEEEQRKEELERQRRKEAERQQRELERKRKEEAERLRAQARAEAMRRKEEEEKAKTQALTVQQKPEILPPSKVFSLSPAGSNSLTLPALDAEALALPDLSHLEREMRSAAASMNLSVPAGRLDRWFGRENHRIAVKTERGRLLAGYVAACTAILVEAEKAVAAAAALQRAKYQLHIDRIRAARTALEEQQKLEAVAINTQHQRSLIEAKVKADIAAYAEMAERSRRAALPPAPPPPAPTPVEEATRKKEEGRRARQEKQELHLDELAEKSSFEQEVVARARKEALKTYHDEDMEAGERFERMHKILDSYEMPVTILPKAAREFMEEEEEANTL